MLIPTLPLSALTFPPRQATALDSVSLSSGIDFATAMQSLVDGQADSPDMSADRAEMPLADPEEEEAALVDLWSPEGQLPRVAPFDLQDLVANFPPSHIGRQVPEEASADNRMQQGMDVAPHAMETSDEPPLLVGQTIEPTSRLVAPVLAMAQPDLPGVPATDDETSAGLPLESPTIPDATKVPDVPHLQGEPQDVAAVPMLPSQTHSFTALDHRGDRRQDVINPTAISTQPEAPPSVTNMVLPDMAMRPPQNRKPEGEGARLMPNVLPTQTDQIPDPTSLPAASSAAPPALGLSNIKANGTAAWTLPSQLNRTHPVISLRITEDKVMTPDSPSSEIREAPKIIGTARETIKNTVCPMGEDLDSFGLKAEEVLDVPVALFRAPAERPLPDHPVPHSPKADLQVPGSDLPPPGLQPTDQLANPTAEGSPPDIALPVNAAGSGAVAPAQAVVSSQTAPPPSRQMAEALVSQPDGVKPGRIELILAPETLGRVQFDIQTDRNGLTITLSAERPETLDLIRRNLPDLVAELRQSGIEGGTFHFGSWNGKREMAETAAMLAFVTDTDAPPPIEFRPRSPGLMSGGAGLNMRL